MTKVRIDELQPLERVVWRMISSFRPEWEGTTITFELHVEVDRVKLCFAHRGFGHADEGYAVSTTGLGVLSGELETVPGNGRGRAQSGRRFCSHDSVRQRRSSAVYWMG